MEQESRSSASVQALPVPGSRPAVVAAASSSCLSASAPCLRFPRPQGNRHLANWVSSSSPDIMTHSGLQEDSPLSESAYELINSTDGESQDGQGTDSITLLDFGRPDDVQSLAGTENTLDDDEVDDTSSYGVTNGQFLPDEEDSYKSSRASSIRYADEALESPSAYMSVPFRHDPTVGTASPLCRPIEFEEADSPMYLDKISVKHTIRDFNEDETADIARAMHVTDPPRRIIATVRQTMSQNYLSTQGPLRVLYVGSDAACEDIIHKICSAFMATGEAPPNIDDIYNVVAVSDFGSKSGPEVGLVESSHYQIQVEHCVSARETVYEGGHFPNDSVYAISLRNGKTYRSDFSPGGSSIQPRWSLPQIAIFYCTEADDEAAQMTRDAAWEIMTRHAVPSIFISNSQSFERPASGRWRDFVDQHAIHLCLESRDPSRPIPHQRLPIDLPSFLNIDARQMNRNLAYLTGLHKDTASGLQTAGDPIQKSMAYHAAPIAHARYFVGVLSHYFLALAQKLNLRGLVFATLVIFLAGLIMPPGPAAPLNAALSTVSAAYQPSILSTVTNNGAVSTSTITINLTTTKTVKIAQSQQSGNGLVAHLPFGGFSSENSQNGETAQPSKRSICAVEKFSGHEILVKMPPASKTSWLSHGSIDVSVFREGVALKTRLSAVDEGIIIEINKKEAFGAVNVSVVSTRRPRITEVFQLDFGKPVIMEAYEAGKHMLQSLGSAVISTADNAARMVEDKCVPALASSAGMIRDDAVRAARGISNISLQLAQGASGAWDDLVVRREVIARRLESIHELHDHVGSAVLKAQIASRLWWLKVQGRESERATYQRDAIRYLKKQHSDMIESRRSQDRCCCKAGESHHSRRCSENTKGLKCTRCASSRWRHLGQ